VGDHVGIPGVGLFDIPSNNEVPPQILPLLRGVVVFNLAIMFSISENRKRTIYKKIILQQQVRVQTGLCLGLPLSCSSTPPNSRWRRRRDFLTFRAITKYLHNFLPLLRGVVAFNLAFMFSISENRKRTIYKKIILQQQIRVLTGMSV
jgi:hypothetical protein